MHTSTRSTNGVKGYIVFLQSSLYHKLRVKLNILLGCPPLGVPLQNDNMKAHIYCYQFIQFWNYTIITYCSSALDTRRSVSTIVFLQSSLYHKLRVKFNILLGCTSAGDTKGRCLRKCSILVLTLLLVSSADEQYVIIV
jgi:ABC-type sugar transport system ATPase subunit